MDTLDVRAVWQTVADDANVKPYAGKRALDVVAALAMCSVLFPFATLTAVQVWRESGNPVFFRHRRVGFRGKYFEVYKFRSMVANADTLLENLLKSSPKAAAEWSETHKLKHDPRITSIGKFLRRTSLDEIPQLLNVLKGEMSLVGPRPVVSEELQKYGSSLPYYLAVKPGLTGLWQVSGRNDVSYAKRVELDVEYAHKQSLLLDIKIMLKTAKVLLGDKSAY